MNVLVTGGGGFLGSAICRQLHAQNHQVVAFQRSPADHLERQGIKVVRGSIADFKSIRSALAGCDAVIHTAGKAGVWGKLEDFERANVRGTANVIRACQQIGIGSLVHTSSPSIVHAGGDIEGADESIPVAHDIQAPYPATKAEAERMVLKVNSNNLKTVALRPHLIWGPGDPHILPRLISRVRRGRLALPGPDKIIDTIFVENAAQAHLQALQELTTTAQCAGKPYFITNHQPLPQREIIQRLLRAVGLDVQIRALPNGLAMAVAASCEFIWNRLRLKSEPPATRFAMEQLATAHWFNPAAAERDFGYRPEYTIEQGLEILARESAGS